MIETGKSPILGPHSNILEALTGAEFTLPKQLIKPNGQKITTRLVKEGVGMAGIEDTVENQEWAGIFNHFVKTAGASLQLGRLLGLNGQDVDLQLMINTVMLSHGGRRQYDEATWYPYDVDNAEDKRQMGDVLIGLANLKNKNLPDNLIHMISVHGLGNSYPFDATENWNEKLPMYLDFRIAQNPMPMQQRFIDLQRGVASGRYSQEFLDRTQEWAKKTENELFDVLNLESYNIVTQNPKNLKARVNTAIKLGKFSEDKVEVLKNTKLYKPTANETEDIATLVKLSPDELLERLQLHPEDINDQLLQPERWEKYIRRLYINDAEKGIFARMSQLLIDMQNGNTDSQKEFEKEFPQNTWWGQYVHELYNRRGGLPLQPRKQKRLGITRAVEFYSHIEKTRIES